MALKEYYEQFINELSDSDFSLSDCEIVFESKVKEEIIETDQICLKDEDVRIIKNREAVVAIREKYVKQYTNAKSQKRNPAPKISPRISHKVDTSKKKVPEKLAEIDVFPFSCPRCSQGFTREVFLKSHNENQCDRHLLFIQRKVAVRNKNN